MITEDYCSSETSKLLKEKGFDWGCYKVYNAEGIVGISTVIEDVPTNYKNREYYFLCPTQQMAMKWLRETHNICIVIDCDVCDSFDFYATIYIKGESSWIHVDYIHVSKDYKQVTDSAIEWCLTNLI